MTINVLQSEEKNKVITGSQQISVSALHEVAETIRDDAINHAREKLAPSLQNLEPAELLKDNAFFDYFKFGLAHGIANVLAANDERVQAIYYFDPTINPDAETEEYMLPDMSINLLILVKSKSAALTSMIASLDRSITQHVAELPSLSLTKLRSILNALLITETDVAERKGYAALLSSLYVKPRKIWSR